jgi:hypothetical protein
MSRALVTFAVGPEYEAMQELALPTLERYAARHGWQLYTAPPHRYERPLSWLKLPAITEALEDHDEVLWLDADVIIVDGSLDLADAVPSRHWQALVAHHTGDGEVPNCGVWYLRPPMLPVLERLWDMTVYLHHGWWEQAALLELLGYRPDVRPVHLDDPTVLYAATRWLDLEWNSHESSDRHPTPRFAHATVGPPGWRLEVLRRYALQPQPT